MIILLLTKEKVTLVVPSEAHPILLKYASLTRALATRSNPETTGAITIPRYNYPLNR